MDSPQPGRAAAGSSHLADDTCPFRPDSQTPTLALLPAGTTARWYGAARTEWQSRVLEKYLPFPQEPMARPSVQRAAHR